METRQGQAFLRYIFFALGVLQKFKVAYKVQHCQQLERYAEGLEP